MVTIQKGAKVSTRDLKSNTLKVELVNSTATGFFPL
jgi:hypothetical protein